MKHIKSGLCAVAVATTLAVTMTGCGGSQESSNEIQQGVYTSRLPLDLPAVVAQNLGMFKKHGVTVKTTDIQTGTDMATAIISGSIDIGNPATPSALRVYTEQEADIVALAGGTSLDFRVLVPAKTPVDDTAAMEDRARTLEGKKIMVIGSGTLTDWWIRDVLKAADMSAEDVTILAASNAAGQIAAFKAGKVDAIVAFGTLPGLIGAEGTDYNILLGIPEGHTGDTYEPYLQSYLATSRKWEEANTETMENYCAALSDATQWLTDPKNHDAAVEQMQKWTQLDKTKSTALLEATDYRMKLDPSSWTAQGETIGQSSTLDYSEDVIAGCSEQFAK